MFIRSKLEYLKKWAENPERKPLIIRGARQVGKTTLVRLFSKSFENYLYFNLENYNDRKIFEEVRDVHQMVEALFFIKGKSRTTGRSLIFIDEIQNSPLAVKMLRAFYEEYKELYVIAAGSLLETYVNYKISFPVGRVEFLYLYPLTFTEFVTVFDEGSSLNMLNNIPFPEYAHDKMQNNFYDYAFIGGMPEIISNYIKNKDLKSLQPIYDSLLISYLDDVEKYANNNSQVNIIRHIIKSSFIYAGSRIKFQGFGNSNYKSREIGEAFRTLEKAMLLKLLYPATSVKLPIIQNYKKSPKLFVLDTGLINFFVGLKKVYWGTADLLDVFEGKIAEQIVWQELKAITGSELHSPTFWVRDKRQSSAEVDFILNYKDMVIPIEVKSGKAGKLRSLLYYMDLAPHSLAIRIYSNKLKTDKIKTQKGKEFTLLSLPFYLTNRIYEYLDWIEKKI